MTRILLSLAIALALLVGSAWAYWTERLEAELTLPLNQSFTLWVEGLDAPSGDDAFEEVPEAARAPLEEQGGQTEQPLNTEQERARGAKEDTAPALSEERQFPPADAPRQKAAEAEALMQSAETPALSGGEGT